VQVGNVVTGSNSNIAFNDAISLLSATATFHSMMQYCYRQQQQHCIQWCDVVSGSNRNIAFKDAMFLAAATATSHLFT
jgi:hypothetical protein